MLQTLKNAWRTKDIRSKLLFTLLILLLYRIGTVIPVPFVDAHDYSTQFSGTILQYLDLLSGGSLGQATLFALGVSPYINASIIIQLLTVVFPKLGEISKTDKKKMGFITRVTTVILAVVTALGFYFMIKNGQLGISLAPVASQGGANWFYAIVIVACFVAGASLVMWLADRINEHGIGNGVSMILFANIVTSLPQQCIAMYDLVRGTFAYEDKKVLFIILRKRYICIRRQEGTLYNSFHTFRSLPRCNRYRDDDVRNLHHRLREKNSRSVCEEGSWP